MEITVSLWYNTKNLLHPPTAEYQPHRGGVLVAIFGEQKQTKKEQKSDWKQNAVLYLHDLIYMLTVILITFLIFFRIVVVNGPSMKMTLLDGDYLLLVSNLFYQEPKHGDVVVVSKDGYDHGKPIVKRVIATQGQIVDMDFENGIVYVDGLPLEEDYINTPTNIDEGTVFPQIVEDGCVFLLGDNRNSSKDSRSPEIGQVDVREILGKVIVLLFPGTDHGSYARDFSRIGTVK